MVKIPKDTRKGRKVIFRDDKGRFVAESERYQRATSVQKLFRGKYETIVDHKKVTPRLLADLLTRDEFESMAANYSPPITLETKAKKYSAWDLANVAEGVRGLRGHMTKVTMNLQDGDRLRKVTFFHKVSRKGKFSYQLFRHMNSAIGNEKLFLYNRIGSKLLPDRKGKQVHLKSIEISKEL